MVKMKLQSILLVAVLVAATGNAAELLSEDFELMDIGLQPTADDIRPVDNDTNNFITVVDSVTNKAGTGKGIEFYDNSLSVGTRLGYDFSLGESAVRFDFSAAALAANGTSGEYIAAGVLANGMSAGTSANRYAEMRVYAHGHARFYSAGSYIPSSDIDIGIDTAYKFTMYVNDTDSEIANYNGPRNLAPNTVDFWVNDSYYISGDLNAVSAGTTNGLGRIGFASSTSDDKLDYAFDNLVVSNITSGAPVDYLLSESYEVGQTPGTQPNGAINVRPNPNNATAFVAIVDGTNNIAGTGQGVQMFDNATVNSSTDITCMEYHFAAGTAAQVSALRVDFAFAAVSTNGPGDKFIAVGLGEYNTTRTFQTTANRYIDARLYNDGTIDFRSNASTNSPTSENNALLPGANKLSIYANDFDTQSVQYTGLNGNTYTLPANSVAYWLNNALVLMDGGVEYTDMDLGDLTGGGPGNVGTTENNLGKFGFSSGTAEYELNYVIDDIYITTNILLVIDNWEEWVAQYQPAIGGYTNYLDHYPDGDGLNNLSECALGGDPTVDDADDVLPTYHSSVEGGTNWLNYVYNRRVFRDGFPLTYYVGSSSTLQIPRNTPTEEAGVGVVDGLWESVTNRISTDTLEEQFIELKVQID